MSPQANPINFVSCRRNIYGSLVYHKRGVSMVSFPRREFQQGRNDMVQG